MKLEKLQNKYDELVRYQVDGKPKKRHDISELTEVSCLNCGTTYQGNFCPCCGQTAKTKRFNTKSTLKHLLFIFTKFDDTFWHTTFNLFTRPGHMIREYLKGQRVDYLRPMQMLICLITIYMIIVHLLPEGMLDEGQISLTDDNGQFREHLSNDFLRAVYDTITAAYHNMIASTMMSITLLSFSCYLVFKRTKAGKCMNYAEHFYAFVYINCIIVMLRFLLLPFACFAGSSGSVGSVVKLLIVMVVYSQMLRISWRKSLTTYILSYFLFCIFICIGVILLLVIYSVVVPDAFQFILQTDKS